MRHSLSVQHENLLLRPLAQDDLEPLRKWRMDADVNRYLTPLPPITAEAQTDWFRRTLDDPARMVFAIEETKILNRLVGSISLYALDTDEPEFGGFMLGDAAARGHGLGSGALRLLMHIAFSALRLPCVYACVHPDNLAAKRAYAKVGFAAVRPAAPGGEDVIYLKKNAFYSLFTRVAAVPITGGTGE